MKHAAQQRMAYLEGLLQEREENGDYMSSEIECYREEYERLQTAADDELMEQSRHW